MEDKEMARLPKEEAQRRMDVVVECYKESRSRSEAAEKLGISIRAVSRYIRIAKDTGILSENAHIPRHAVITKKEDHLIVYLYESGLSKKDIANKMGVSWITIHRHLKACGITQTKSTRYDIEFLQKVADAYNCGCSTNEIGLRMGINEKQVFYATGKASKLGLLKSFPGRCTEFRSAADMVSQGYNVKEIAEKMHYGEQTIYRYINTAIQQGLLDPDVHVNTGHRKYTKRKGSINK